MKSKKRWPNVIMERSFLFALDIVRYSEELEKLKKFVIARQLIRSGTSVGASIREAQAAESKRDFIHKMKISAKEAEETEYWLLICQEMETYPDCEHLVEEVGNLNRILTKIIHTAKKNLAADSK